MSLAFCLTISISSSVTSWQVLDIAFNWSITSSQSVLPTTLNHNINSFCKSVKEVLLDVVLHWLASCLASCWYFVEWKLKAPSSLFQSFEECKGVRIACYWGESMDASTRALTGSEHAPKSRQTVSALQDVLTLGNPINLLFTSALLCCWLSCL